MRKFLKIFLISVASLFVVLFAVSSISTRAPKPSKTIPNATIQPQSVVTETSTNDPARLVMSAAKAATPAVVGISTTKADGDSVFDGNTKKIGMGSGVIVTSDGYILTNNHVAGDKNNSVSVSMADGRTIAGTTVWTDPIIDLAVVKVNLTGLPTIPLGDSNTLQVGETAIAIGNPLGFQLQRTVTSGIISALNRTIKIDTAQGPNYMEDLIQTDAGINPGNSGGPLINSKGQVVGINTIKVESAEAIGFAIPINAAAPVIKQFSQSGKFTTTYMGVFAYDKDVLGHFVANNRPDSGIYVATVDETSPAYKCGLKKGCIITKLDDTIVNTMLDLRAYIHSKKPGDTIKVTHVSDGKTETVDVVLGEKNGDGLLTR